MHQATQQYSLLAWRRIVIGRNRKSNFVSFLENKIGWGEGEGRGEGRGKREEGRGKREDGER